MKASRILDLFVPLEGASHADVERYDVCVPMRYSECRAILKDGRKVGLRDSRQLAGWRGKPEHPVFLFDAAGKLLEVCKPRDRAVSVEAADRGMKLHRFVRRDGSLFDRPGPAQAIRNVA